MIWVLSTLPCMFYLRINYFRKLVPLLLRSGKIKRLCEYGLLMIITLPTPTAMVITMRASGQKEFSPRRPATLCSRDTFDLERIFFRLPEQRKPQFCPPDRSRPRVGKIYQLSVLSCGLRYCRNKHRHR